MKRLKRVLTSIVLLSTLGYSGESSDDILVKITKDIPYVKINDSGVEVKIQRIQDTSNILSDDFARTSRPCPPHCITKIEAADGVKTIGELELIDFIKNKVYKKRGILVDARLKKQFVLETIPGAINIPFTISEVKSKKVQDALFKALGARIKADGSYDFSKAKELVVFCSGLWCAASVRFIKNLTQKGYPKEKIYYYRDGLQAWKLLGLTTVVHKAIEAK
jgi:rhodanese-related sulfurtransferase